MTSKLILIVTPENRRYLTKAGNLSAVKELATTFEAEVFEVTSVKEGKPMTLKELSVTLCDPLPDVDMAECEVGERLWPVGSPRSLMRSHAARIRRYVRNNYLAGRTLRVDDLKGVFGYARMTDNCLRNHLWAVRKEMEEEGRKFDRAGHGVYFLVS